MWRPCKSYGYHSRRWNRTLPAQTWDTISSSHFSYTRLYTTGTLNVGVSSRHHSIRHATRTPKQLSVVWEGLWSSYSAKTWRVTWQKILFVNFCEVFQLFMSCFCRKTKFKKFHVPCFRSHSWLCLTHSCVLIWGKMTLMDCYLVTCVCWWLVNNVSGKHPPRLRGLRLLEPWRWNQNVVPKHR
jgi:hypothetical protein